MRYFFDLLKEHETFVPKMLKRRHRECYSVVTVVYDMFVGIRVAVLYINIQSRLSYSDDISDLFENLYM